jgi:hypothetical protein
MAEKGSVPPFVRRKFASREMIRRRESQRNVVISLILIFLLVVYVPYNLSYWRSARNYNNTGTVTAGASEIDKSNPGGVRGRTSWVTQDAQPFVSLNGYGTNRNTANMILDI